MSAVPALQAPPDDYPRCGKEFINNHGDGEPAWSSSGAVLASRAIDAWHEAYYDEAGITLYHNDCHSVLPSASPASVNLLVTDPPYGIGVKTNYKLRKRSALAECNDWGEGIVGDSKPFSPSHLLAFPHLILFGANYYANELPHSPSWLIWDKLAGLTSKRELGFNDSADVELIWTNFGGPARLIPHRWMGAMKGSERDQRRVHPTQKPIALMRALIEFYSKPGDLILDPYAGAGSTLIAAAQCGRRAIGIEIEERYCEVAAIRLAKQIELKA